MIEGLFVAIDQYNRSRIEQGRAAELFACSAVIAKYRLRQVIAADRKAVPTGRWVRRPVGVPGLWLVNMVCGAISSRDPAVLAAMKKMLKPRYRWERRK